MGENALRRLIKAALPQPVRRLLRACLHFAQRVGRWPIILCQVRGATWADQWVLLRSALAAPVIAMHKPMVWQDPLLLADCNVAVQGVGRFHLRARCDDLWHVLPWRERSVANHLKKTLGPGDVFIDAGANIGFYTLLAARIVGSAGKVLAIEMMPDTANQLARHIKSNGLENVIVIRSALSDLAGMSVVATVSIGKYGQASIAKSGQSGEGVRSVLVDTVTLDSVSTGLGQVRLMKIDLEGAELPALIGGAWLLERTQHIIYESWGKNRAQQNPIDVYLCAAGFHLSQIDGNNWLACRRSDATEA